MECDAIELLISKDNTASGNAVLLFKTSHRVMGLNGNLSKWHERYDTLVSSTEHSYYAKTDRSRQQLILKDTIGSAIHLRNMILSKYRHLPQACYIDSSVSTS